MPAAPRAARSARPVQPVSPRLLHTLRDEWPRLVLDVVVLVLGISLSFEVEEWRQDRETARNERRSWQAVHDDLVADTLSLAAGIRGLDDMIRGCAGLLGTPPADSVDVFMDRSISYTTFLPSASAFQELRQTGSARQLANRKLFNTLSALHNGPYEAAAHWDHIDEQLVLDRMYPYLEVNAPADYALAQTGAQNGRSAVTTGLRTTWLAIHTRPGYRNLLGTNLSFKQAHRTTFAIALTSARRVLARVDAELARSR